MRRQSNPRSWWLTAALLGGWSLAHAQEGTEKEGAETSGAVDAVAEVAEESIAAKVVRLSESRDRGRSGEPSGNTSLTLQFEPPLENAELLRVELTQARDSTGKDLLDSGDATGQPTGIARFDPSGTREGRISLRNSAREAKEITELAGVVTFHDPSRAQAPILLTDFRRHAGAYTPNPKLEALGISVAYLDEATFDAKGGKLLASHVFAGLGLEEEEATGSSSMALAPMKMIVSNPGIMAFIITDPDKRLVRVEGLGAGDEAAGAAGMESTKGLWVFPSPGEEQAIERLRFHLRSEDAEVSYRFTLSGIPLP